MATSKKRKRLSKDRFNAILNLTHLVQLRFDAIPIPTTYPKLMIVFFTLFLSLPLFGQMTPIDSLAQLPTTATMKEKAALWNRIDVFIRTTKNEKEKKSFAQQYLQIAKDRNDSLFLSTAHFRAGYLQKHKEISRNYGYHLDKGSNEIALYNTLNVYHDKKGNTTFEEISNNDQLFGDNNTFDDDDNYDPTEVYWGKLVLHGNSEKTDEYILHFSPNRYLTSWKNIDTWMVHANDSITYYQTGDQFLEAEKPIPSQFNMLRYTIQQNEKVVLYFRMEGVDEERVRKTNHIRIFLLEEDQWPGFFPSYPFKGDYYFKNANLPFATNVVINHDFWIDPIGTSTIEEMVARQDELDWKDASKILIESDKVSTSHQLIRYFMSAFFRYIPFKNKSVAELCTYF